ncbi:hypothetical protein [Mycolicibacter minnesotensis]|nr:MAG: hypothetical protein E6R06_03970 [Mycobacterium sp.]
MTTAATPAQTDHRTKARRMWQVILVVFAVATIAANITYGALGLGDFTSRTVSALIHALPPLAFLLLVEALLLTAKSGIFGRLYRTLLIGAVIAAAVAFTTSYFSLLALSREHGHMPYPQLDYALPVLFDLVMGLATIAVFGLGEKPMKAPPKPQNAPKPPKIRRGLLPSGWAILMGDKKPTAAVPHPTAGGAVAGYLPQTHPVAQVPAIPDAGFPHPTAQVSAATPAAKAQRKRNGVPAHIKTVAQRLHGQRIARKLDADDIARILVADAEGEPPTRIAADQEVHRDTVYRIIEAAEGGHKLHATN